MPVPDSVSFSRPAWAEIDLSSLRANARLLRGARGTPLIAVVKANAYGHGAVEIARALQGEVISFAVASIDEGRALRRAGIEIPILILSATLPCEADAAIDADLTITLSTLEGAKALNQAAQAQNATARAHWKIDTGMGRVGTWHEDAAEMWRALLEYSRLEISGVYTHFACADEADDCITLRQIAAFENALNLCEISSDKYLIHAANSAASLRFSQAHMGAIRSGIALYGASPLDDKNIKLQNCDGDLQPVMSLHARVTEVRKIAKGRTLSYGATWTAARDSQIALVPLGYADGYPRALSNKGEILIGEKLCRLVGRVTMDQILVDITQLSPNVQAGEIVTAWGRDASGVLQRVEHVAAQANTISYELLTGVSARIPRVYIN